MRRAMSALAGGVMLTVGAGAGGASEMAQVTVARQESKPRTLEISTGKAVRFVNVSGRTAHIWFGENDAVLVYIEKAGSTIKFEKPGTYNYTVRVTAGEVRSHTGTIIVK
jgi:plastocyanin